MEVIVLKDRLTGIHPAYATGSENQTEDEMDHELSVILGEELDEEGYSREIKAYSDRIKILEEELQRSRAEAYQAGFEEGQRISQTEARKRFSQASQEFSASIHATHKAFEDAIENLSAPVLTLALGAAEKIIQQELELDEKQQQILLNQIQRALNETATQTRTVIQVNAKQLEWITGLDVLKQLNVPHKDNLRFIPNPKLGPGEILLETEDYLMDGTIHTQLQILEKALKDSDATDSLKV